MDRRALVQHDTSLARQPLTILLAAAAAGIVVDRYAALSLTLWLSLAVAAWAAWWVLWRRLHDRWAVCPLLLAVLALGAAWHHACWYLVRLDHVATFAREVQEPAAVEAVILQPPRQLPAPPFNPLRTLATPPRTQVEVAVHALRDDDQWRAASGRARLTIDGQRLDLLPGQRLRIFGQLARIRAPLNPGEFDFAAQARCDGLLCQIHSEFPECIDRLSTGSRWNPWRIVGNLRESGQRLLNQALAPQRAGLAAAMFLGSREGLDTDATQAYLETGTIHLLVISGLNVGILAVCTLFVMRVMLVPRLAAILLAGLACVLYAVMTGAEPPVVRATIMVLIGCAGLGLARRTVAFNVLAAAGLVVLLLNPAELFQAGTQLSFLSVATLIWMGQRKRDPRRLDPLDRLIHGTRPWHQRLLRQWGSSLATSVMASVIIWLVICPLVMTRFHLVSPIAVLLGPVLALPVGIAMAAGFGILGLGNLLPPLSQALGWLCDACLQWMEFWVQLTRSWPGSFHWVAGPGNWWLAGFYALLAWWVLLPRLAPPRRWCLACVALWITVGMAPALLVRPAERLQCTFLSVGHGTAIVVQLPDGKTLLYDAGRLGSPTSASRAVADFLWQRGITHIDAVVLSHADADHYNALPELLQRFSTGVVYVSPMMFERHTRSLDALRGAIETADVSLVEVWSGDQLRGGGATIEVLHPPRTGVLGTDNANSIVLSIEFAGRRLLLTGDLESPGLDDLMADTFAPVDVVLTPHHGSAFSDPPGFAAWASPRWAIVSGGEQDRLETVADAYTARGCQVLHTATSGAISVELSRGDVAVETWR